MAEGERSASMAENGGEGEKKALDEWLAGAGYNVRPSELRQVAQKLEQLEMALDATQGAGEAHLSKDAVHYNPSDLGTWIDSMLHELSTPRAGSGSDGRQRSEGSAPAEDPGFELAEAAGFLVEDQNVGGLFGLLEVNEDEDDGEASLFHEIQGPQLPEEDDDRTCEFLQKKDSLPRSRASEFREFQQPYPQGMQSSSCSSESTDENCRPRKFPRLEQSLALCVEGVEPQTLQPQQDITSVEDYIQHIDQDSPEKDQGFNDLQPQVAGSRAREECSSGVRLVHALMACAEAIQQNNLCLAQDVLKHVKTLAASTGGAIGKVVMCFSEALVRRIYGFPPQDAMYLKNDSLAELLEFHFYETCPYLKFAHFTANQAILEAFQMHKRVHVIDFSLKQGIQWPALIQALALRPGGPPALRLTGIGPPNPEGKDVLHEVGLKLAQLADSVNVEFDFRGYVAASLSDIKPWMLDVRPGEALAVNSIFQLHGLVFSPDPTPPPLEEVLASVRALNPKIITIVEQEAHHNSPVFVERFTEALHYYSTMFDSLEARRLPPRSYQQLMSEMYLARSICNIVACEGDERVERHETLLQWRLRMHSAGFRPLHLGSNAFKQASMLLTLFSGGNGHRIEENNGCLTLGWHNRPLIAASAWQCP